MVNYTGLQFASCLFIIGEKQVPIKTGIQTISTIENGQFFGYRFFIHPKTDLLQRYAIFPAKNVKLSEDLNKKLFDTYSLDWKCIRSIDENIIIDRLLTQISKTKDDKTYIDIYSNEDLSLCPHYLIGKMDVLCLSEKDQVLLTI